MSKYLQPSDPAKATIPFINGPYAIENSPSPPGEKRKRGVPERKKMPLSRGINKNRFIDRATIFVEKTNAECGRRTWGDRADAAQRTGRVGLASRPGSLRVPSTARINVCV